LELFAVDRFLLRSLALDPEMNLTADTILLHIATTFIVVMERFPNSSNENGTETSNLTDSPLPLGTPGHSVQLCPFVLRYGFDQRRQLGDRILLESKSSHLVISGIVSILVAALVCVDK
jgi:hypothetical protein